jgi:hypothetical protein
MDERFGDSSDKRSQGMQMVEETEKDSQLDILGQILGPGPGVLAKSKSREEEQSVGRIRYDPTLSEHKKFEKSKSAPVPGDKAKGKERKEKAAAEKASEDKVRIEEEKEALKDSTSKPSFKVAPNLKTLFAPAAAGGGGGGFSLRSAFGGTSEAELEKSRQDHVHNEEARPEGKGPDAPEFWKKKKNPFKYDSSDEDEGEGPGDGSKGKKKKKVEAEAGPKKNYFMQDMFRRDPLFFQDNDERLKGVFETFLRTTEDMTAVRLKFNESGRSELRAIARSKYKNSKRKGEKKIKIMRLVRKKKRREALKKQKGNSNN